jgi:glycosyltransferase involved in cell wall biosynthesis
VNDRPLRVLAIASHAVQYASPVFRRLACHPHLDFHVAYCSLRGAEAGHDPEFGEVVQWDLPLLDGYEWTHVANRGTGSESFFGLFNPGLWRLIRKGDFDAVITYVGYVRSTFWIAYFAARSSGAAFIFGTDATSLAPRDGRGWKTTVKKHLWPRLFRLADQVTAPSEAGFELMRSLRIPESRVTFTPFTVDNDWWTAKSVAVDRQAARRSWGVTSDQQVVLFCAKLQPWKRPADLLHAFAHANVEDSILIFAGTGPLRNWLELEAASLGVAGRVRFFGFVNQSQLPAMYTSADLFVLPSEYDPCPVVVCEALLCGCPVIISDQIRGRFDLIHAGKTGEIFPTGDVDALARLITNLFSDRANLLVMRNSARERMRSYSPLEAANSIVTAVFRAVSHRRPNYPPDGHGERS